MPHRGRSWPETEHRLASPPPREEHRSDDRSGGRGEKLGNLATAQGNLPEAQRLFGESLRIRQRLAESDPANAAWQRDLAVSHFKLAHYARASGDDAGFQRQLRECYHGLHQMQARNLHFDPQLAQVYQQLAGTFGDT